MDDNLAYVYEEESWDEMIDGNLVAMSPHPTVNHNIVASNIYRIFANYLKGKKCVPFADGTDLYLTKKDRFVPDGMIVCDIISEQEYRKFGCDERKRRLYQGSVVKCA